MALELKIDVKEQDGFKRGGVSYPLTTTFPEGACYGAGTTRVTHPDGSDLPIQIDTLTSWSDDSIREAIVSFPLRLPADGSGTYTLLTGPDVVATDAQPNPVKMTKSNDRIVINQGPVTYEILSSGYNVVDGATFDRDVWKGTNPTGQKIEGPKPFLKPGSPPPSIRMTDGTERTTCDRIRIDTETAGPRTGRIRVTGQYSKSLTFTSLITFYSGVSWYQHVFSLSGDSQDVASVVFEDTLDLEDGPLTSAYGSRINSHGHAGSWAVVTDGISTVDVAAYDAWSSAGSVRYEIEPDGRFRIIAPYTGDPIRTFYHFLITPPADHYHTPAAAMVADPHIRLLDSH